MTYPNTLADFQSVCDLNPGQLPALQNYTNFLVGLSGGNQSAKINFAENVVQASGTITIASTGPTNGETCTIAGVTITAETSGAVLASGQFNISSTPTTCASNIAACLNATTALAGILTATSALGVVTVTITDHGASGNGIVMANVNLANTTFVSFAGGSSGLAANKYSLNFL